MFTEFSAIAQPCIAIGERLVGDWHYHIRPIYDVCLRVHCCESLVEAMYCAYTSTARVQTKARSQLEFPFGLANNWRDEQVID